MSRRVLLTGAAGFVGRRVLLALHGCGHEIVALTHREPLPDDLARHCYKVCVGDLCEPEVQREALTDVDSVCHLAAFIPPDFRDPDCAAECNRVNGLGTLALARMARASGVDRFLYLSAANSYGWLDRPALETDAIAPTESATYYLVSKFLGEMYLLAACLESDTAALVLRAGTPYGPGEPSGKVTAHLVSKAIRREALRVSHGGLPRYNFIYVDDISEYVVAALSAGAPGIYNIGSGESTTLADLASAIVQVYSDKVAKIQLEPATQDSPRGFAPVSIEKALATWEIVPTRLAQGLLRYRRELEAT